MSKGRAEKDAKFQNMNASLGNIQNKSKIVWL